MKKHVQISPHCFLSQIFEIFQSHLVPLRCLVEKRESITIHKMQSEHLWNFKLNCTTLICEHNSIPLGAAPCVGSGFKFNEMTTSVIFSSILDAFNVLLFLLLNAFKKTPLSEKISYARRTENCLTAQPIIKTNKGSSAITFSS